MSSSVLVETDDRWLLPLAGRTVERMCLDYALTLVFDGGFELRIEQPFLVETSLGEEVLLVPEGDPDRLAPVVSLARQEVVNADAFKDGHLEVVFSRGTTLRVPTDESFEAWEFVGPDGLRTVSLPGGDLAVWRSGDDAAKT